MDNNCVSKSVLLYAVLNKNLEDIKKILGNVTNIELVVDKICIELKKIVEYYKKEKLYNIEVPYKNNLINSLYTIIVDIIGSDISGSDIIINSMTDKCDFIINNITSITGDTLEITQLFNPPKKNIVYNDSRFSFTLSAKNTTELTNYKTTRNKYLSIIDKINEHTETDRIDEKKKETARSKDIVNSKEYIEEQAKEEQEYIYEKQKQEKKKLKLELSVLELQQRYYNKEISSEDEIWSDDEISEDAYMHLSIQKIRLLHKRNRLTAKINEIKRLKKLGKSKITTDDSIKISKKNGLEQKVTELNEIINTVNELKKTRKTLREIDHLEKLKRDLTKDENKKKSKKQVYLGKSTELTNILDSWIINEKEVAKKLTIKNTLESDAENDDIVYGGGENSEFSDITSHSSINKLGHIYKKNLKNKGILNFLNNFSL